MKLWVFSDLHLTHAEAYLDVPDADVCVCAGDVSGPTLASMRWLQENVSRHGMPVVFVAGNHEHYGQQIERSLADAEAARLRGAHVHFLEDRSVVLGGVRFIGATLWTDYALFARGKSRRDADFEIMYAMESASVQLTDHERMRTSQPGGVVRRWTPLDARKTHERSRRYLERTLAEPHNGPTVVVSHHGPHPRSVSPEYEGDALNPAFVSDLSDVMEVGRPDLWIHGHVHSSCDYVVGDTRVLCNPRGYVTAAGFENRGWDPGLVIEVESRGDGDSSQ